MTRVLVALSVLAPVVVGGAAFVLIAKALAGWLWGLFAVAIFALVYGIAVVLMRRWALRNPGAAEGFLASWGRGLAFGSGGWERSSQPDSTKEQ